MARQQLPPEGEKMLASVPPGEQYDQIRHMVYATWLNYPDVAKDAFFDNRIDGFIREIKTGVNPNRPGEAARDAQAIADDFWNTQMPKLRTQAGYTASGQTADGNIRTKQTKLPAEKKSTTGVGKDDGDPKTPDLKILTANEMKWYFDAGAGKWYVGYGLPGSDKELLFEAAPDQMDALFGKNQRPANFARKSFSTLTKRPTTIFAGNVSEMEGTGSFENEYNKVIAIAKDSGALPSWMKGSKAANDLIFIAETENKSDDWLLNEFSKLPSFKKRFPGLEKIRKEGNLTLGEAVEGFLQFEAGLRQAAEAMGFPAKGVTPSAVGGLLDRGWNLKSTTQALQNFRRQKDFAPAMEAFNQILAANGIDPISTQKQYYEFLEGKAPQAYYDIYEASSIQEAANQAGLGDIFDAQDSINAALAGEYDLATATKSMQQAAQLLLRMRSEVDMGKFGLSQDELIDVSLGLAPTSGRTETEVFEEVNRATLAAQASLKKRSQPYKGFSSSGTIKNQSLGTLRQET